MWDAFVDLVLGGRCVGCAAPGRALCPSCRGDLPDTAVPRWPSPTPPGLVTPWAAADYAGLVRAMVLAHKERGVLSLGRPLGSLLARSIAAAVPDRTHPVLLVPVPSRPGVSRARGHDPAWTITRTAAATLRREGYAARPARLLRVRGPVADQAGLDAQARAANLAGSQVCLSRDVLPWAGLRARVVVCDDVLTTGSTLREAQRALSAAGLRVEAGAVVAATVRRVPGTGHSELSGLRLSPEAGRD